MKKGAILSKDSFQRIGIFFFLGLFVAVAWSPFAFSSDIGKAIEFGPKLYMFDFYSVSAQKNNVWVVGNFGNILYSSDGNTFGKQTSSVTSELYDVDFISSTKGWVVGRFGVILATADGGKTWIRQKSGKETTLLALHAKDQNHAWAVGEWGTILHTEDGQTWITQDREVDNIYNDVFFVDLDYGWVVGERGTILHTRDGGKSWFPQHSPFGEVSNFSVSFKDKLHGVISAMDGRMLFTMDEGKTWKESKSPTNKTILSVQFVGEKVYGVGLNGTGIISSDGGGSYDSVMNLLEITPITWYSKCNFIIKGKGWVVGGAGKILKTTNGGKEWKTPAKLIIGGE